MPGAVIMVIALLIAPVLICMGFAAVAVILGAVLNQDGEARHEGSELLDIGV